MQKNKNNQISWLGIRLTKKNSIYLTIFSSICASFFVVSIFFAVPVLIYARTDIFPYDRMMYTYTLLLSISNFLACAICISIFAYTLSKVKTFRKALKNQKSIE
jgi:ABC-type arginine transport system permease subunit